MKKNIRKKDTRVFIPVGYIPQDVFMNMNEGFEPPFTTTKYDTDGNPQECDVYIRNTSIRIVPLWKITCECTNEKGETITSTFVVRSSLINSAINTVENKIDTDIWTITSVYMIKPTEDDNIIYTNYPII